MTETLTDLRQQLTAINAMLDQTTMSDARRRMMELERLTVRQKINEALGQMQRARAKV